MLFKCSTAPFRWFQKQNKTDDITKSFQSIGWEGGILLRACPTHFTIPTELSHIPTIPVLLSLCARFGIAPHAPKQNIWIIARLCGSYYHSYYYQTIDIQASTLACSLCSSQPTRHSSRPSFSRTCIEQGTTGLAAARAAGIALSEPCLERDHHVTSRICVLLLACIMLAWNERYRMRKIWMAHGLTLSKTIDADRIRPNRLNLISFDRALVLVCLSTRCRYV